MKAFKILILGVLIGVGVYVAMLPHARYEVHYGEGMMWRVDSTTGKTWLYGGELPGWVEVPEAKGWTVKPHVATGPKWDETKPPGFDARELETKR